MSEIRLNTSEFLYDKVARVIQEGIEDGALESGDRVPSLRAMSRKLGVSIATVNQAYVKLEDNGVIESRPQSGFYVRRQQRVVIETPNKKSPSTRPKKVDIQSTADTCLSAFKRKDIVPLGIANTATELLPVNTLAKTARRVISEQAGNSLEYNHTPGDDSLRKQIAFRGMDSGTMLGADSVLTTTGAVEALTLSLSAITRPGDVIAVESPTYFVLFQIIQQLGLLAVEIDTNPADGIELNALANALKKRKIAALFLIPNFNNPLGSLMPDDKKKELVKLLARTSIPLIEDDIYGELYFTDKRPINCLAYDKKGLVVTCSSFSKTLAPGYRTGWIMGQGQLMEKITTYKRLTALSTNALTERIIAEYLHTGHFDRHLNKLRRENKRNVDRYRNAIGRYFPNDTRVTMPQGGFVLWVQMPRGVDANDVFQHALKANIAVTPGELFSATGKYKNYMRISAGYPWTEKIDSAIKTLGAIVNRLC